MNRTLSIAAAALLLSTGLGTAAGLVPGSDHTVREEQNAADWSVVTGPNAGRDADDGTYGYPAAAADRAPAGQAAPRAAAPAPAPTGKLVPGSDSF